MSATFVWCRIVFSSHIALKAVGLKPLIAAGDFDIYKSHIYLEYVLSFPLRSMGLLMLEISDGRYEALEGTRRLSVGLPAVPVRKWMKPGSD